MDENLYIRSSAAEYLIFSSQAGENGIEVRFEDGTAWLTQKAMAELFGVDRSVIGKHLKNVFAEGELEEKVVCALFAHTTQHGAIKRIIEMTALLLESGQTVDKSDFGKRQNPNLSLFGRYISKT